MKYMIASDIHGSAFYCRKLLEAFEESGANRLVLLGDILYHGPRNDLPKEYAPKEVLAMLNGCKDRIYCVRGNCDTEVDQMVLELSLIHISSGLIRKRETKRHVSTMTSMYIIIDFTNRYCLEHTITCPFYYHYIHDP